MTQIHNSQIPTAYRRTVRRRHAVLEYAARHSIRRTTRHFTLDPKTIRAWRTRHQSGGLTGLVPRYPARRSRRVSAEQVELVAYARRTLQYGATRTPLWLVRIHQVRLAQATIQRIFRDLGLPRLQRTKKRAPKQLTLFEKPHPGDSVQIDTKVVKVGREKVYQYTALDDCTRLRVLRLYRHLHVSSSLRFLTEVCCGGSPSRFTRCSVTTALNSRLPSP